MFASLTAGCAASSHPKARADFRSGYLAAAHDYRTQFTSLQTEARSVLGQDLSTQLGVFTKMSKATKTARQKLRALAPPSRIKALYTRLLTALDSQQTNLGQIEADARRNDDSSLNNALSGYATALQNGISLLRQMDAALGSKSS
jgi:hypothetical protein